MTRRRATSLHAQAVGWLARREYARAELEQKLIAEGWEKSEVRAALDELAAQGYLSDARYANAELNDDAALAALWQRRFGRAPADEREKARQVRFLQSRGFALSAILKLLRAKEASGL